MHEAIIAVFLIAAAGIALYIDNTRIDIDETKVVLKDLPSGFDGLRIVHLSDLHYPYCVRSPKKLAEKVKELQPDMIALTGDLTDRFCEFDAKSLTELAELLVQMAPCYAVAGNHEMAAGVLREWTEILSNAGVTVLNNAWTAIERDGAPLLLGGRTEGKPLPSSGDTAGVQIVLSHFPEAMPAYADAGFDLVLSGHAHGGQVRLFGQGLFSPGERWFPTYTSGLYKKNHTQMVVSRGLKSGLFLLRIFNAPHIPVITLCQD